MIPFPTVRAVLSAVEAGRVDAGIVYRTDATTSAVRVVASVSPKDHPYLDIVVSRGGDRWAFGSGGASGSWNS